MSQARSSAPRRILTVAIALTLAVVLAPSAQADEGEGWWSDLDKGDVVRLGDVIAKPRSHAGRSLTFFCVFRGPDKVFIPQSTIFTRLRYANVSVWPDVTPIWQEREYAAREYPFLYAPRRSPTTRALLEQEKYTRLEVTGRVRSIYRGRPCIEIESWRPAGHRLGRQVVDSMVRGDALTNAGQMHRAMDTYARALRPDLPKGYATLIKSRIAGSLKRMGALSEAAAFERTGVIPGSARHAGSMARRANPAAPGRRDAPGAPGPEGDLIPAPDFTQPGGAPGAPAPTPGAPPPNSFDEPAPPPASWDVGDNPDAAPDGLPSDAFVEPLPPARDFDGPPTPSTDFVEPRPVTPVAPGSPGALPGALPGTPVPETQLPGRPAPVTPRTPAPSPRAGRTPPPTRVPRTPKGAPKRTPRLVGVR